MVNDSIKGQQGKEQPVIPTGPRRQCKMAGVQIAILKGARPTGNGRDRHLKARLLVGDVSIPLQVFGNFESIDTSKDTVAIGTFETFVTLGKNRKVTTRLTIPNEPVDAAAKLSTREDMSDPRPANWISTTVVDAGAIDLVALDSVEQRKAA